MKIKLLAALLLLSVMAYSQEINIKDVPQGVLEGFEKVYPGAKIKKWEKADGMFFASLISDGQPGRAEFTPEGQWNITYFDVNPKELPSTVTGYCQDNFAGFKIDKANYVETEDKTYYFVVVKKEGLAQDAHADLSFDVTGKLIDRKDVNLNGEEMVTQKKPVQTQRSSYKENPKQKTESNKIQSGNKSRPNPQKKPIAPKQVNVPGAVKAGFAKKFPRAMELTWDTVHKKNYLAMFKFREQRQKAEFSPDGKWISSTTVLDPKKLYTPVARYIQDKFPDHKIKYAENTVNNMRKNSYYVQVFVKEKGEMLVTQLYFDKSGKIDKIIDPDITDEPIPSTIDEEFDSQLDQDINAGKVMKDQTSRNLKEKELPTPIAQYVKRNFPEYKIKRATYEPESEYGEVYYLHIRREGVIQPDAELFFNIHGKLIKKIDANTDDYSDEEVPETAPGLKAPDAVDKNFRDKFPGATDITWDKDEAGNFTADFMYKNNKCKSDFKPDGTWLLTVTEVNEKMLPAPITSYIQRTYKNGKIQYSEYVEKPDKKNYYSCEVVEKKKEGEPETLYFTSAGRPLKKTDKSNGKEEE